MTAEEVNTEDSSPQLCVITPVHATGSMFLREAYDSLVAQTRSDWRWYILENNGGTVPDDIRNDGRVVVMRTDNPKTIGALKRELSMAPSPTSWIVELDCDDVLHPDALEKIAVAFESGADFVFSDSAAFEATAEGVLAVPKGYPYGAAYGWSHYAVTFRGATLAAMSAPPVTPQNLRLIEWCPNHVRAWTRSAYDAVGGHDVRLPGADDHDLVVRMFLNGARFVHVAACLYFYRVHETNTVKLMNPLIRGATWQTYNKHLYLLAERFAREQNKRLIDLGGAVDAPNGYTVLDNRKSATNETVLCNLEHRWPLEANSVGVLRAHDVLEHLRDPAFVMSEAYRVLAPGGYFLINVPSSSGKGAFCDPSHVSFWNDLSFRYYTNKHFAAKYCPRFVGAFQNLRVIEWFPSQWHKTNNVPYVQAHLIKLAPGYEPMGEVLWPTRQG